jgi:DnaA family protein
VREDLRTRLGWGLVFHLTALTDEGKASVLKHAARERGIALADDLPAYLLTHFRRDMPSLMALLDELDRFSLEQKRAVTLTLLRDMTRTGPAPASAGRVTGDEESPPVPDTPDTPHDEPTDLFGDPLSIESVSASPEMGSPRASTRFK